MTEILFYYLIIHIRLSIVCTNGTSSSSRMKSVVLRDLFSQLMYSPTQVAAQHSLSVH